MLLPYINSMHNAQYICMLIRAPLESFTIHVRLHIDPFGGLNNKLPPMTKMENSFIYNMFIGSLRISVVICNMHQGNGNHSDQSTVYAI